jgi:hypothetical protein
MTILLWQKPLTQVVRQIVQRDNGAWFDPSDLSTLFQDAAGTIPVTAVGQPVGKMLDKSGNGYHATQSITAYRPALMQDIYGYYYLAFDGIDNYMSLGDVFDVDKNGLSMIAAATVSGGARHPIAGNYGDDKLARNFIEGLNAATSYEGDSNNLYLLYKPASGKQTFRMVFRVVSSK